MRDCFRIAARDTTQSGSVWSGWTCCRDAPLDTFNGILRHPDQVHVHVHWGHARTMASHVRAGASDASDWDCFSDPATLEPRMA